ncbi:MAG: acyl-CoA reductase [Terriglobia bacterium]
MSEIIRAIGSPGEIAALAAELRETLGGAEICASAILDGFEAWAAALAEPEAANIPGVQFLRMWLRRGTLEPILARELGGNALCGGWMEDGRARLKAYPLGVVGHWPAGNIEIQPVLSMTCAMLGGNASFVRVPERLSEPTRLIMEKMEKIDSTRGLTGRVRMLVFDHARRDLQEAMARSVDGAMIWGGEEAVLEVRSLPFPHWGRLAVFGPRISIAAMDADSWSNTQERDSWCKRIARDVWQFDQQACSSPQALFLEKKPGHSAWEFVQSLRKAFESENRLHPREEIHAALTTAICQARASWLLDNVAKRAIFPPGPDWTILLGSGSEIPQPTQGKTLTVLEVDDLLDPIEKLDGNVQTLGLAMADAAAEAKLASVAARKGVDRIVKLGRMHVFIPPWDGVDLIRPMVRMVRHACSTG